MTLNVLFSELNKKLLDPSLDIVIECLLRKVADTNKFVAKEAEQALQQVCESGTDTKVFKCLNAQQLQCVRSNSLKRTIGMGYCFLITRIGS